MAILTFGPIATGARGSIGGVTFSRSRSGPFARGRIKPCDTTTNRRDYYRSQMAFLWTVWKNELAQADRDDWQTLADATTFTNSLGQTYHPAAWPLFLRANSVLVLHSKDPVTTPPAQAVADYYPIVFDWYAPNAIEAACPTAPAAGVNVSFWLGRQGPQTRTYYRGPYVAAAYLHYDPALPGIETPFFNYSPTSNVYRQFLRTRSYTLTGEVSAPYYQFLDPA